MMTGISPVSLLQHIADTLNKMKRSRQI